MWHLKLFAALMICLLLLNQVRCACAGLRWWGNCKQNLRTGLSPEEGSLCSRVYGVLGVIILPRCTDRVSTLPYLRLLCLCPTGRWLPRTGTEFNKEEATEDDPVLERGLPQAHWILLPGRFGVYHEAVQVFHKLESRAEDRSACARTRTHKHTPKNKSGTGNGLGCSPELPGESVRVQEQLPTGTTKEWCLSFLQSPEVGYNKQRKEMWKRWLALGTARPLS